MSKKKKITAPDGPALFPEALLREPFDAEALASLRTRALACKACSLRGAASRVVFGDGNALRPDLCFVGEAPGVNEDAQGRPFVGKAGELLGKMIEALGYTRERVYICNTVNCRPPGNRKPEQSEVAKCSGWLTAQLHAVRPKVIVAMGATAAFALTGSTKALGELRGKWFEWEGVPLRVTFHPAYLLRNPPEKAKAWLDLQAAVEKTV